MEFESMEIIEVNSHKDIPEDFTGIVKFSSGTQCWYLNGLIHRDDGPAVIWNDGKQAWYFKGVNMTPIKLFEKLSDEQKEKALWNLNQWK